jgi:hypothetical protein
MTTSHPSADYPLGNTDAEHERLIRRWVITMANCAFD